MKNSSQATPSNSSNPIMIAELSIREPLRIWKSLSIEPVPTFLVAKNIEHAATSRLALPDVRGWVIGRLPPFCKPDKSQPQSFVNEKQSEADARAQTPAAGAAVNLRRFDDRDIPPLGQPNPGLERIAGPQKIMLALAALGAAVLMSAMFYLLIVMQ